MKTEDGRRKTEDRRRKTEDRRQKTEDACLARLARLGNRCFLAVNERMRSITREDRRHPTERTSWAGKTEDEYGMNLREP